VGTSVALGLILILPNLSIAEQGVVIIVGVMPTMISTLPIASKYQCNCDLLSMTIAISFIMSAISLLFVAH
jgi:predicted permease